MRRRVWSAMTAGVIGLLSLHASCMSRPVGTGKPTTKEAFSATVTQKRVDKLDILFMVDNSASMGDKTRYLRKAIPDLLTRLINPNCVDAANRVVGRVDAAGACAQGKAEFPPVLDMHIGVVTSAMGPRLTDLTGVGGYDGGTICAPGQTVRDPSNKPIARDNDDRGRLVNRSAASASGIDKMKPSNFLSWLPASSSSTSPSLASTPHTDGAAFLSDFADLVSGIMPYGCGIESQLESFYRFLIQPDPYERLELSEDKRTAKLVGFDREILRQRRDFLRPDSLVAVVVLSDENDSEIDVRAFGGQAHLWLNAKFAPYRATAACAADPSSAACTSCAMAPNDANCAPNATYDAVRSDWNFDVNLRHVNMKQRYGVDLQYPLERYVLGLSSKTVPDRMGEYPVGAHWYRGHEPAQRTCVNPLFARSLPNVDSLTDEELTASVLCHLEPGARPLDHVFYAHIGGVPWQLLVDNPKADSPTLKPQPLSDSDWTSIVGKAPERYDLSGIDPHMIESQAPRAGLPGPSGADSDEIHGRDWTNNAARGLSGDLQYACTFELEEPRDCSTAVPGTTLYEECDCLPGAATGRETVSPVCNPKNPTQQLRGKTYPTIRELRLAKELKSQGIVASMCPIHTKEQGDGDPLYGYRPAMKTIVDRLKDKLSGQCLPRKLSVQSGRVACLILEELPEPGDQSAGCSRPGLRQPEGDVLARYRERRREEWIAGGGDRTGPDPGSLPVCEVDQLEPLVDCRESSASGWCYVEGSDACPQSVFFSKGGTPKSGARIELVCIQETAAASDG